MIWWIWITITEIKLNILNETSDICLWNKKLYSPISKIPSFNIPIWGRITGRSRWQIITSLHFYFRSCMISGRSSTFWRTGWIQVIYATWKLKKVLWECLLRPEDLRKYQFLSAETYLLPVLWSVTFLFWLDLEESCLATLFGVCGLELCVGNTIGVSSFESGFSDLVFLTIIWLDNFSNVISPVTWSIINKQSFAFASFWCPLEYTNPWNNKIETSEDRGGKKL